MAFIINKLKHSLPLPKEALELTYEEIEERNLFKLRDGIGTASRVQEGGLKPMNIEERKRHRKYQAQEWAGRAPRWDGNDFPFAAYGEPGCAYELPAPVARFLAHSYNQGAKFLCEKPGDEILHVLLDTEELPAGMTAKRMPIDDPMEKSSESYSIGGRVVSAGKAEPPPAPVLTAKGLKDVAWKLGDTGVPPAFQPTGKAGEAAAATIAPAK